MVKLEITRAEKESRTLTTEHLQAAVRAMETDGFVALENVINQEELARLRDRMFEDLPRILARKDAPYNWHTGNVQHDPPPFPPYLFRDVLLNDQVVAVTKSILGPGVKNTYYSGNTSMPGGREQPVHVDLGQLWPDLKEATPPYSIVVNVPVVDMDVSNGSTEIWPGTHLDTTISVQRGDIKVPPELVERRRQVAPPLQPTVRAGGILLRDIRVWHRGMPNHTQTPRPLIAMIHAISWWSAGSPIPFPQGIEAFFEDSDLRTNARFVAGPIDYIHLSHAYEYEK
jgi:hypothetical protein